MPKTIDEFFIEKYEKLEQENQELKTHNDYLIEENLKLNEENEQYKNKFIELINRLKEDLQPKIATIKNGDVLIEFARWTHFKEYSKIQYEFYKNLFDLKEEGEENE